MAKVKNIHFLDNVPGQPIYEMENGDIRLPFPSKDGVMHMNEQEALTHMVKNTPENKESVIFMFAQAKKMIKKKFLSIN